MNGTKHHYPRRRSDRELEIVRRAAMPSLGDLDYSICCECGREVGEAYRGRLRACQHCGQLIGPNPDPSPAQIAEAAARVREHSRAPLAAGKMKRNSGQPAEVEDDAYDLELLEMAGYD